MSNKEHTPEPTPWILGGASGRMITTPSGYYGDGFIADVDTKANAALIVRAVNNHRSLIKALEFIIEMTYRQAEDQFGDQKTMLEKEGVKCKVEPMYVSQHLKPIYDMDEPEMPIIGHEYPEKKFTGYLFTKI